ncbi:MAG TPA: efflux RND transporter periplasmic adaptor subunit [Planctomycetota bacterium]|nr:efflux RND transporter periplasmic adaptor subunit [Planctomycetota bacterium]
MARRLPQPPKIVLPTISLLGILFALSYVAEAQKVDPPAKPLVPPPRNPYGNTISGNGIIEPAAERTVSIGPTIPGVVLEVRVAVGDVVSAGAPLFRLDDRALVAERDVRAASLELAKAKLARLKALPRPEEVPPAQARVDQAEAALGDLKAQLARLEKAQASGRGVVALDELDQRRFRTIVAEKALAQARSELDLLRAGAWQPDLLQAKAEVLQAEAMLKQTEVDIDRSTVKAPTDATVLQVSVREGMYAQPQNDLVLLGNTQRLNVRVDVDEESAPLVRAGCKATALIKNFPDAPVPLEFVRIEPWVQPKKSLTGDNSERVDTRVLQVIFRLGAAPVPVYVGQQVDVFMEGAPRGAVTR